VTTGVATLIEKGEDPVVDRWVHDLESWVVETTVAVWHAASDFIELVVFCNASLVHVAGCTSTTATTASTGWS
jgi:hypothetical protein